MEKEMYMYAAGKLGVCNFLREGARVIAEKYARRAYVGRRESVSRGRATGFFARETRWFIINERWADFRRKPLIIEPYRLPRNRARSTGPDRDCRDLVSNYKL